MCDPVSLTIAATAVTAGGQIMQGVQQSQQAAFAAHIAQQNRQLAVDARRDAIDQGQRDQIIESRKQAQLQGEQRVALAGSGVDANFGTSNTLAEGTALIGAENATQIDRNTAAQAKSLSISAANYASSAAADKAQASDAWINAGFSAAGTILGGASQVKQYQAFMKRGIPTMPAGGGGYRPGGGY